MLSSSFLCLHYLGRILILFGVAFSIWKTLLYNGRFLSAGSHLNCDLLESGEHLVWISLLVIFQTIV